MALLAPGVGFIPTDETLVGYYLVNKNSQELPVFIGCDLIKEVNLYAHDPFELRFPSSYTIQSQRQFFCFTAKVEEEVRVRHCNTGFWMMKGTPCEITGAGNVVLGTKTLFIFYLGCSPNAATRTDWVMYEYTLANKPQAPFVVCRILKCPRGMDLDSEFGLISEVAVDAGEDVRMNEVEQNLQWDAAVLRLNEVADAAGPSNQNEKCVTLIINITLYLTDVTTEHIDRAVMEGDFIELADLY